MQKVHIVSLRDDGLTSKNIDIALSSHLWGMRNGGKHKSIATGDYVMFLIGVSIDNLDAVKKSPHFVDRFPNFTNITLQNQTFISQFAFKVNRVIWGHITQGYFRDASLVWEPQVGSNDKPNYFEHRFAWVRRTEYSDFVFDVANTNSQFLADVILSLRDKGAQPSTLSIANIVSLGLNHPATGNIANSSAAASAAGSNQQVAYPTASLVAHPLPSINQPTPVYINQLGVDDKLEDLEAAFQEQIQVQFQSLEIPSGPLAIPVKLTAGVEQSKWARRASIAAKAIQDAEFKCEVDSSHITFVSKSSGKQFVEAHHLIPMEFQADFKFSIDIPENILVLCPNCHRKFHHGTDLERSKLLQEFLNERVGPLKVRGISVDLEKLEVYYGKS